MIDPQATCTESNLRGAGKPSELYDRNQTEMGEAKELHESTWKSSRSAIGRNDGKELKVYIGTSLLDAVVKMITQ
jgi:hypothetical protein